MGGGAEVQFEPADLASHFDYWVQWGKVQNGISELTQHQRQWQLW